MFQNLLGHQGKIVNVDHSHRLTSFDQKVDMVKVQAFGRDMMARYPKDVIMQVIVKMYEFLATLAKEGMKSDALSVREAGHALFGTSRMPMKITGATIDHSQLYNFGQMLGQEMPTSGGMPRGYHEDYAEARRTHRPRMEVMQKRLKREAQEMQQRVKERKRKEAENAELAPYEEAVFYAFLFFMVSVFGPSVYQMMAQSFEDTALLLGMK